MNYLLKSIKIHNNSIYGSGTGTYMKNNLIKTINSYEELISLFYNQTNMSGSQAYYIKTGDIYTNISGVWHILAFNEILNEKLFSTSIGIIKLIFEKNNKHIILKHTDKNGKIYIDYNEKALTKLLNVLHTKDEDYYNFEKILYEMKT